jgi:hypothetical protein
MKQKFARIKDGALIGCDMSACIWKDNGEVFEVEEFTKERNKLKAPNYGGEPYGNGCLYVKKEDLIPDQESNYTKSVPMPTKSVREQIAKDLMNNYHKRTALEQADLTITLIVSEIKKVVNPYKQKPAYESISETNIPRMLQERAFESARQAIIANLEEAKHE